MLKGLSWSVWSAGVPPKFKGTLIRVISFCSFIYPHKYVLSTFYVLGIKLDVGIIIVNKTDTVPALMDFSVQLGIMDSQTCTVILTKCPACYDSADHVLGPVLGVLYSYLHLMFLTPLRAKHCYSPHSTSEETKTK